jgi:hypothetical protein
MQAVIEQSKINLSKVNKILDLYSQVKEIIRKEAHTAHFESIANFLFCKPVFKSTEFIK